MTQEQELIELIEKAKQSKAELRPYTTKVAQLALEDMICQAEKAVNGEELPFSTKREFGDWHWTKEDACQFAKQRYTMASGWFHEGKAYCTYGLVDALEWYQKQDLRKPLEASELDPNQTGFLSIEESWNYYEALCKEALTDFSGGDEIGQCSSQAKESLLNVLTAFSNLRETANKTGKENEMKNQIAAALADCLNALWELRMSRHLRSEMKKEAGGNILCSASHMEEIREKIKSDPLAAKQYQKIKEIADGATLEQRKHAYQALFEPDDYEKLNLEFVIETNAGNRPSFSVPAGTVSASFSLILPKEENEKEGLGHIQVWNIGLKASEGENIHLSTEKEGITLCNSSPDHDAVWTYEKKLSLRDDALYTLMLDAKQDGKFKKGMRILLTFFDKDGNTLGTHEESFNRKSWLNVKMYNLYTQCDAICYWYTNDTTYAEKSKIEMLHFLDDFCQGAHHWLRYNERPEGSDAYGGVQGGRILFTIAVAYSMICDSGVWSKEEKERFYGLVSYLLRYMADLRDRTLFTKERTQRGSSNWQTDMHIGSAAILMALPDFPDRKIWMYNSASVLRSQLDFKLNQDGSWPESIRYHFASLEHFSLYARLWERESGENWFASKQGRPGLIDMFRYPLYMQTPPYSYFDDCIATPPFGDHKLGNGSEFALYGLYCDQIDSYNHELAQKMQATWFRAKQPIKGFWGESVALENLMYPRSANETTGEDDNAQKLSLTSCSDFSGSGIYIFRDRFGTPKENYLAVMASKKKIGHGHLDQGAFIYYYHRVPIVMDSGIEGYFEASTPWHICSYSHAVMQFEAEPHGTIEKTSGFINLTAGTYSLERGWNDGPSHSKVTKLCMDEMLADSCESISLEIENPKGSGIQHRNITMDHQNESITIQDTVTDFSGDVLFNLPLLAKSITRNEKEFFVETYEKMIVKIGIHSNFKEVIVEEGRATAMAPGAEDHTSLLYLRIKAKAEDGFLVTIKPSPYVN